MSTLQTVLDMTRLRLADASDLAYDTSMLTSFYNDAIRDFCSATGVMQDTKDVTTSSATMTYASLSSHDVNTVYLIIVLTTGVPLQYAPPYEAGTFTSSSGAATAWSTWGRTIYLNGTTTDLRIFFTYIPDALINTTDAVLLPDQWLPAIAAYMEFRCRSMDRETGLADRAWAEYVAARTACAQTTNLQQRGGTA